MLRALPLSTLAAQLLVLTVLAACATGEPSQDGDATVPLGAGEVGEASVAVATQESPNERDTKSLVSEPLSTTTPATSTPTLPTGGIAAPSPIPPPASEAPIAPSTTLRDEIEKLFDTWTEAFQTSDAALLLSTLSQDYAEICQTDKMQEWIEWPDWSISEILAVEVTSVFTDAENPDRAIASLNFDLSIDYTTESHSQHVTPLQYWFGLLPVLMEEGSWRVDRRPLIPVPDREEPMCAFEVPDYLKPAAGRKGPPDIGLPGLDLDELDGPPSWESEPGTLRNFSSWNYTGSNYMERLSFSGLVGTPLTSGELLVLYQNNLGDPAWNIRDEGKGIEGAWLTWTVHDYDGNLWYGSLAIASAGVDMHHVWLVLRSTGQTEETSN